MNNDTTRFEMRIDSDMSEQIDMFAKKKEVTRSEAVRILILRGLGDISKGEKLILATLNDFANEMNLKNSQPDINLIVSAISSGKTWAIDWEHEWLEQDEASYKFVKETVDILSMWNYLEYEYTKLTKTDRTKFDSLNTNVKWATFPGFDGNNDPHYGIALFLIESLKRFTNFDAKKMNSHYSGLIPRYLRMIDKFNKIQKERKSIGLNELIEIAKEFEIKAQE